MEVYDLVPYTGPVPEDWFPGKEINGFLSIELDVLLQTEGMVSLHFEHPVKFGIGIMFPLSFEYNTCTYEFLMEFHLVSLERIFVKVHPFNEEIDMILGTIFIRNEEGSIVFQGDNILLHPTWTPEQVQKTKISDKELMPPPEAPAPKRRKTQ